MTISSNPRSGWLGSIALAMAASTVWAIDLDLTPRKIEAALNIARGREASRAAFHKSYVFPTNNATVESIEVITEFRRVVQIAEARIAFGDHMFAQGTQAAQEAVKPFRRRVSLLARLRFHPQNAYVLAPPVDVALSGGSGQVPSLDARSETLFALPSNNARAQQPVVGAVAEAIFDATAIGQTLATAIVRMDGKELAMVAIDFSRLE